MYAKCIKLIIIVYYIIFKIKVEMKINKIILTLVITISLTFSIEVSLERSLDVAENFYFYKNDPRSADFIYTDVELISIDNENIFHAIKLEPIGFILISANDVVMPILGYSFESIMSYKNLPNYEVTGAKLGTNKNITFIIHQT